MEKPILSVIVLNYNTKDITLACLASLTRVKAEIPFEVILIDNGSSDDSCEAFSKLKEVKLVRNATNLGFAKGNNSARNQCEGKYILFLNSDTIVTPGSLKQPVDYLEKHPDIGVLTVKQVLKSGKIDPDSRRSFPTPWVAFTHFSFLDRLFPKSPLFARYWYGYRHENSVHDIDVSQGAYFLTRREILDSVDWFSEDYFLDGEDIDLSWKIKQKGYRVVYYPKAWIHHLKKATKDKSKFYITHGVDSMLIFYKKWLWNKYPLYINWLVVLGVNILKLLRQFKKLRLP